MPQLIPFYFTNQVIFTFVLVIILIYIFSKYILPKNLNSFVARTYISKL